MELFPLRIVRCVLGKKRSKPWPRKQKKQQRKPKRPQKKPQKNPVAAAVNDPDTSAKVGPSGFRGENSPYTLK